MHLHFYHSGNQIIWLDTIYSESNYVCQSSVTYFLTLYQLSTIKSHKVRKYIFKITLSVYNYQHVINTYSLLRYDVDSSLQCDHTIFSHV